MSYNHGKAEKIFQKQWKEKKSLYIKFGMTEEQIDSLYELEREQFNSNRRFYENNESLFESDSNKKLIYEEKSIIDIDNWQEEIEDNDTYNRLKQVPQIYLKAYIMHKLYYDFI